MSGDSIRVSTLLHSTLSTLLLMTTFSVKSHEAATGTAPLPKAPRDHGRTGQKTEGGSEDSSAIVALDTVQVKAERLNLNLNLDQSSTTGALGTKRLLDTPFSVTIVTQDDIARRQATTLGQIFINDPSVSDSVPTGSTTWNGMQIRGIGTGASSYYVDGIPVLMGWGGQFPLEAVETVQALKGLGGFMYGFGSPGGIISYQTKKPTDDPLLAVTVGYRNPSVFSVEVDAGGRLNGQGSLGYRLNTAFEHGDAYNASEINRKMVSLAVDKPIGDGLTWHAAIIHEDSTRRHEPFYFYWDLDKGGRLPRPTYRYENVKVDNSFYKLKTLHATTGLKWSISDTWSADFTVGGSRREHRYDKMFVNLLNEAGDYTGNVFDSAFLFRSGVAQLVVSGTVGTGPVDHDLVFGMSYQRAWDQSSKSYWKSEFTGNIYQRQPFLSSAHTRDFSLNPVNADQRQRAIFASDTLHFSEHWQAILGARQIDYEERDLDGDPSSIVATQP